jgi:hypothetical protein
MSNSTTPHWVLTWGLALALAIVGWIGFEGYWRTRGYVPTVMDSKDLWSQYRARAVKPSPPLRVAMLGASRIQYGFSPEVFREEAKRLGSEVDPIMLALNGQYPLATLRDLAQDKGFRGLTIVGIDAMGFDKIAWEMQADSVAYYQKEFTPARELHRRLLTRLQPHVIAARPDFAWSAILRGYLDYGGPPAREYVTFTKSRAGATDYSQGQAEYLRNQRIAGAKRHYSIYVPPTPEKWLDTAREVVTWVEAINARGGRVVFYREPVSSAIREYDERYMPRAKYLDALAKIMPATFINFEDHPQLNIDTPDTSHIDQKDIPRHTIEFVRILHDRGLLTATR